VTSTAGYLALGVSSLELVREFGLVLGASVVLSYCAARLVVWCAPPAIGALPAPDCSDDARDPAPDLVKVDA
jgi:hypothetical protein